MLWIQASNPRVASFDPGALEDGFDMSDFDISEVISHVFASSAENAYVVWNRVHVPMSYKYDLPYMVEEMLDAIGEMTTHEAGRLDVCLPSNSFRADWSFEWKAGSLRIASEWGAVAGHLEEQLRKIGGVLETDTETFVAEWAEVFRVCVPVLSALDIGARAGEQLQAMRRIIEATTRRGLLYSD